MFVKVVTQLSSQSWPIDNSDSLLSTGYTRALCFNLVCNGGNLCVDACILVLFGSLAVSPLMRDLG